MARLAARVLNAIASVWPNPLAGRNARFGDLDSDDYHRAYAREQYMRRVRFGMGGSQIAPELWGKTVLEIGCGHGGISCYLASIGAKSVVGVDVNEVNLRYGRELASFIENEAGRSLPVEFQVMDAHDLRFAGEAFDLVIADNLFEHVDNPQRVLSEAFRVLRPGGLLLVPVFSAIRSKYGLHLKQGLKVPWANLIFSEATIVEALRMQAERRPELHRAYPGLVGNPQRVREVRRHHDLNDITHDQFLRFATQAGFEVTAFQVFGTPVLGRAVLKFAPTIGHTKLGEVLSTGASALLTKPAR